ncbi:hypothetical protein BDY19DRAFT_370479 [Irpex rosettiformis]|uniref:Uncharacterized protein n=1 Tax=Irpex rosettiformis TaxID=378272 RepID=A0ACB8TW10_9APHY|nr:hypothetical protein BDY19DRAFT_370479 [Irpex rosettiformis]
MGLAAEVYAEQLLPKAHGLPLWIPEPSKFGEVLIGDVGYVYDGCFYRLFNVTHPPDDDVNQGGVPEEFEVLEYDPCLLHRVDQYLDAGVVCSKSVARADVSAAASGGSSVVANAGIGYRFSCSHDQGALLILKSPASQEVVHPNRAFRDYMRKHHDSWYDFARRRGLDIQPGHIILVRGWVKTSEWAVAAFTDSGKNHEVNFEADAGPFAKASFSVSYSSAVSMSVEHRTGPTKNVKETQAHVDVQTGLPQDQCVFLSYYEIKSRGFWTKKKIRAAAEPQDECDDRPPGPDASAGLDSDGSSDDSDIDEDRPRPRFVDSLNPVLDYILQNSDAQAAIASDDDIRRLLPDGSWPDDVSSFLDVNKPHITVDSSMSMFSLFPWTHADHSHL